MGTLTAIPTTLSTIMSGSEFNDNVLTTTAFNKMGFGNFVSEPFIINPSCINSWTWDNINFSTIQLKPTGVRASCMPDPQFWDETFDFMPGVCPQDWIMYDIGRANVQRKDEFFDTKTTAYCCPQGYKVTAGTILGMALSTERACFANFPTDGPMANITVTKMPDRAHSGPSTRTFAFGDVIQPAWHIIWADTDQPYLLPPPPTLGPGTDEMIATWTPPYVGPTPTAIDSTTTRSQMLSSTNIGTNTNAPTNAPTYAPEVTGSRDNSNCYSSSLCSWTPGIMFAIMGVPIIVFILFVLICVYFYRRSKKAKRNDAQRRFDAADGATRGEPELVVVQPETMRVVVSTGLSGKEGKEEGGPELPVYSKEKGTQGATEAPPAYTPAVSVPAATEVKE